jgi:sensor domain CHASE-containing protein
LELTRRTNPAPAILRAVVRPLAAGLLASAAGVAGWWLATRAEDQMLNRIAQTETRLVAARIESAVRTHEGQLEEMARRWEHRPNAAGDDWKADVFDMKAQTPAFRAMEWREPSHALRWAAPLTALAPGGDLDSLYEERRRATLTLATGNSGAYVSATYFGGQEHRQLSMIAPMRDGDAVSGYLVGVARVRDLLDQAVQEELRSGYSIAVHEGPYLLYGPEPTTEGPEAERFSWTTDIEVDGLKWKVEAWPGKELSERLRSPIPLALLSIGVMIGIFAAAMVRPGARPGD